MSNYDKQLTSSSIQLNELKAAFDQQMKAGAGFNTLKKLFREIKALELKISYQEIVARRKEERSHLRNQRRTISDGGQTQY